MKRKKFLSPKSILTEVHNFKLIGHEKAVWRTNEPWVFWLMEFKRKQERK